MKCRPSCASMHESGACGAARRPRRHRQRRRGARGGPAPPRAGLPAHRAARGERHRHRLAAPPRLRGGAEGLGCAPGPAPADGDRGLVAAGRIRVGRPATAGQRRSAPARASRQGPVWARDAPRPALRLPASPASGCAGCGFTCGALSRTAESAAHPARRRGWRRRSLSRSSCSRRRSGRRRPGRWRQCSVGCWDR